MNVLFLGISGVLHPSRSAYLLVRGSSPWADGHHAYEGVQVLERALSAYPQVRIVLTSTQPPAHGLPAVLTALGAELAARVVGFTYEELTRDGVMSPEDYWRLDKCNIVAAYVQRLAPRAWVAIDDESMGWPQAVRDKQLVLTNPCEGLLDFETEDRLQTVFAFNFSA